MKKKIHHQEPFATVSGLSDIVCGAPVILALQPKDGIPSRSNVGGLPYLYPHVILGKILALELASLLSFALLKIYHLLVLPPTFRTLNIINPLRILLVV